jgi:hypothetical protein
MKTREVAVGGLLTALALIIPFAFRGTPLQLFIPTLQYSATFASHVPSMLSMLASPATDDRRARTEAEGDRHGNPERDTGATPLTYEVDCV